MFYYYLRNKRELGSSPTHRPTLYTQYTHTHTHTVYIMRGPYIGDSSEQHLLGCDVM
jgi:hypothetical protein